MTSRFAVVTGAASPIGRATAISLLEAGWTVVLTSRNEETLRETARLAGAASSRAVVITADIGSPDAVAILFAAISQRFGRLDLLINNAANFVTGTPIEDLAYEDWARSVQVNLTGSFLCAQQAYRIMKAQSPVGGRIINIGGLSAHSPRPDSIAYTATKHAITGLTKSLSLDGRKYDIACGQVDLGNAERPSHQPSRRGARQADGTLKVEPVIDVSHVADTIMAMARLPLHANIPFVTVIPTKMPFVGRG